MVWTQWWSQANRQVWAEHKPGDPEFLFPLNRNVVQEYDPMWLSPAGEVIAATDGSAIGEKGAQQFGAGVFLPFREPVTILR